MSQSGTFLAKQLPRIAQRSSCGRQRSQRAIYNSRHAVLSHQLHSCRSISTSPRLFSNKANNAPSSSGQSEEPSERSESSSPLLRSDRKWSTPLAKTLTEAILTTGPIPISSYMRQCLTFPEHGYYTSSARSSDSAVGDQFGNKGDFITSPEISQMFGEMIGIWTLTEWMGQGSKTEGVVLVEVGPGRGTLMDDILRTIRNFRTFAKSIETIYLVEAGPNLRNKQRRLLCGEDAPMEKIDVGYQSKDKYLGVPVVWLEDIRILPQDASKTPFIFAHEFFDALPIHAFQSVAPKPESPEQASSQQSLPDTIMTPTGPLKISNEQQDILSKLKDQTAKKSKSANSVASTPQWRELVVSPNPNAFSNTDPNSATSTPEFQLSLAPASTPHSLLLPETSERYQALKSKPGSIIEISPDSLVYAEDFAQRIGGSNPPSKKQEKGSRPTIQKPQPSGAALILDYGTSSTIPSSTLRGIANHTLLSPLSQPGRVDISADVDFTALAEAAIRASPGVEVHGPVEQGDFLLSLGIAERAAELAKRIRLDAMETGEKGRAEAAKKVEEMERSWRRLVQREGDGMGKLYKALAIVPESGGKRRPVAFGGMVVG